MLKNLIQQVSVICLLKTSTRFERIERRLAWILFGMILSCCIWLRLQLPNFPIPDSDSWGFLNPALSWISGNGLEQTHGRAWLYPVVVAGFLNSTNGFSGIIWWQHIFAILSLLFLWLGLRSWQQFLPPFSLTRAAGTSLALLAVALFGLNPETLRLEAGLRPESLFQFGVIAQLFCLINFIKARWHNLPNATLNENSFTPIHVREKHLNSRSRFFSLWLFGSLTIGFSYVNFLLKPSWGISLVLSILPIIFGLRKLDQIASSPGGKKKFTLSIPYIVTFLVTSTTLIGSLILLPIHLGWKRDSASITHPALTLFSIHADIILQSLKKQSFPTGQPEETFRIELIQDLETVLNYARTNARSFSQLGFDPDYIMYRSNLPWRIRDSKKFNDAELAAYLKALYFQAWKTDPLLMIGKVAKQMQLFAFPHSSTFYKSNTDLASRFEDAASIIPAQLPPTYLKIDNIYSQFRKNLETPSNKPKNPPSFFFLQSAADYIGRFAPIVQILFFLLFLIVLTRDKFRPLRLAGASAFAIALASYGNALSLAIFHSLDVNRYRYTYGPFLLMGLIMMAVFCLATIQTQILIKQKKTYSRSCSPLSA